MAMNQTVTLKTLDDASLTVANRDDDVRGRKVIDSANQEIGKVDALLIDEEESKVRFLRLSSGGFLGIGDKHFLIPVDAVTQVTEDAVHIDQTSDRIVKSPAYDPDLASDVDYYGGLYGYYGYAPFWGAGYVYPRFPY